MINVMDESRTSSNSNENGTENGTTTATTSLRRSQNSQDQSLRVPCRKQSNPSLNLMMNEDDDSYRDLQPSGSSQFVTDESARDHGMVAPRRKKSIPSLMSLSIPQRQESNPSLFLSHHPHQQPSSSSVATDHQDAFFVGSPPNGSTTSSGKNSIWTASTPNSTATVSPKNKSSKFHWEGFLVKRVTVGQHQPPPNPFLPIVVSSAQQEQQHQPPPSPAAAAGSHDHGMAMPRRQKSNPFLMDFGNYSNHSSSSCSNSPCNTGGPVPLDRQEKSIPCLFDIDEERSSMDDTVSYSTSKNKATKNSNWVATATKAATKGAKQLGSKIAGGSKKKFHLSYFLPTATIITTASSSSTGSTNDMTATTLIPPSSTRTSSTKTTLRSSTNSNLRSSTNSTDTVGTDQGLQLPQRQKSNPSLMFDADDDSDNDDGRDDEDMSLNHDKGKEAAQDHEGQLPRPRSNSNSNWVASPKIASSSSFGQVAKKLSLEGFILASQMHAAQAALTGNLNELDDMRLFKLLQDQQGQLEEMPPPEPRHHKRQRRKSTLGVECSSSSTTPASFRSDLVIPFARINDRRLSMPATSSTSIHTNGMVRGCDGEATAFDTRFRRSTGETTSATASAPSFPKRKDSLMDMQMLL